MHLSPQPDVRVVDLSPADRWLVLATDGVWEAMESQEVVDICARHQGSPADATKAIGELTRPHASSYERCGSGLVLLGRLAWHHPYCADAW